MQLCSDKCQNRQKWSDSEFASVSLAGHIRTRSTGWSEHRSELRRQRFKGNKHNPDKGLRRISHRTCKITIKSESHNKYFASCLQQRPVVIYGRNVTPHGMGEVCERVTISIEETVCWEIERDVRTSQHKRGDTCRFFMCGLHAPGADLCSLSQVPGYINPTGRKQKTFIHWKQDTLCGCFSNAIPSDKMFGVILQCCILDVD